MCFWYGAVRTTWVARLLGLGMVGTAAAFNFQSHTVLLTLPINVPTKIHFVYHALSGISYLHALLLFPNGRLVPRAAKWPLFAGYVYAAIEVVAATVVGAAITPFLFVTVVGLWAGATEMIATGLTPGDISNYPDLSGLGTVLTGTYQAELIFLVVFAGVLMPVLGGVSQLYRYQTLATALERQQSKLLLYALGLAASVAVTFVALAVGPWSELASWARMDRLDVALRVFPPPFGVIPIALFVAIVRHRVFNIDLLINRTVLYGAMTVILGTVFLVGSTLAQRALEAATGQRSDLLTVGVALFVAAGFQPLRRRTKAVVDRFLPPRQALTLLFTDIVGSTGRAIELGDQRWREVLDSYRTRIRSELKRFGGHEVDTSGDGFFATFHSPVNAVRCAQAIVPVGRHLGLETRVGLHCGECEMRGEKVSGVNVHVAARVMALAGPGEVLISDALRDWLADGTVAFVKRGVHTLRGIPGEWRLYALVGA